MMRFIFHAKGLEIKSSKSKIENEIPIISYKNLKNQMQKEIFKKIRENSKKIISIPDKNPYK